ncbi:ferritin-like protein [Streptomyces sp. NPDC005820]|uniref:ferritin-like domain-containing protein n=1 Tax=Streptomyces sp. NPDC005820 TaxID=3157069 RepID=UPI0033CBF8F4
MTTVELDYSSDGIVRLLRTPPEQRSPSWLKDALQQAIMLELATLPPYLCGWWSLLQDTDSGKAAAAAIRVIVFDEMSHLGHVCNLLTTIGGSPRIADPSVLAPYPCPLPGGVRPAINPGLEVYLGGLTKDSVEMYSQIEAPEEPLAQLVLEEETFASIGLFYTAILEAFRVHQGEIRGTRQVIKEMDHGEGNSLFAIRSLADAEKVITIIKEQGEGTEKTPDNPFPGVAGELSHYYVFREIFRGRKLKKIQETPPKWDFQGDPIPFPNARPMGKVPKGGWANDPATVPDATARAELDKGNAAFSAMLHSLEEAWKQDRQEDADQHLGAAIGHMFALKGPAVKLMNMPLPNDPAKRYGPEFRFVATP